MTYVINLETASGKATLDLYELDAGYVGSQDYLGLASFWDYELRHYMRDASIAKRKKIHQMLLESGETPIRTRDMVYFKSTDTFRQIIKRVLKVEIETAWVPGRYREHETVTK